MTMTRTPVTMTRTDKARPRRAARAPCDACRRDSLDRVGNHGTMARAPRRRVTRRAVAHRASAAATSSRSPGDAGDDAESRSRVTGPGDARPGAAFQVQVCAGGRLSLGPDGLGSDSRTGPEPRYRRDS